MADNAAVLQELRSLREELAELAKERRAREQRVMPYAENGASGSTTLVPSAPSEGALTELKKAIAQLAEATGHTLAEHPAATHLTALVVGILLGRMLAR